jgi:hypothetical protein
MQASIAKNILASLPVAARYFFWRFAACPLSAAVETGDAYGNEPDHQWRTEIL